MTQLKQQPKTGVKVTRILIADDHPIVRQGLSELINRQDDMEICALAADGYDAMQMIKTDHPDMAVIDIMLRDISGIELIKDIKTQYPDVIILALSMHDESLYAERALRAGARGYVMKGQATEEVLTAIRKVRNGDLYISEQLASKMMRKLVGGGQEAGLSPVERLSDRELEVFLKLGHGQSTREIADQLHLSVKTIETYRAHIKEKLNLANSSELLQYAIQWVSSQG